LGTGKDMQIVDDSAPTQIEEVFSHSSITSAATLPLTHMSKRMLDSYPFAQFGSSLWCLLALTQLDKQSFIRMNAHTTAFDTGRTLGFQGTPRAGILGKVDHTTRHKRHLLRSRTADDLPLPI
jgi:hypothetical protein